jgi:ribonuclease D
MTKPKPKNQLKAYRGKQSYLTEEQISVLSKNPNIIKVGVGIRDDIKALNGSRPLKPKGFVDLQVVASDYGIKDKSFSKLMAILFGVHTSKRQRVTNWAADELTEAQIRYAATDAWGACIMYNKLKSCEAPVSIKSEV